MTAQLRAYYYYLTKLRAYYLTGGCVVQLRAQLRLLLSNKGVCYEIENYYLSNEIENGKRTAKTHREHQRKLKNKN